MGEIQKQTCIRFVARTNQADYIYIYSGSGCSSWVGKIGGKQQVSLLTTSGKPGGTCMTSGIIQHELTHGIIEINKNLGYFCYN